MWGYRKLRLGIEGTCRNAILWRLGVNLREAGYRPCGFRRFRIGDDSPGTTEERTHDSTPATSGQTCLSVTWY